MNHFRSVADAHVALSDAEWAEVLKRSINQRVIDGVRFPGFPDESTQAQFVGSSNEAALQEAYNFYHLVKGYASALGVPLEPQGSLLDLGCGWGRFLRFFWRDFEPGNLFGVDIDPEIVDECIRCEVQANMQVITANGRLPFEDGKFTHIIAYSVFTHLPEDLHLHWLSELSRVARPGCVFVCTTEPRRFLQYISELPDAPDSPWLAGVQRVLRNAGDVISRFDNGEFIFLPTGGGKYRDESVYGDAVIPKEYISSIWSQYFALRAYIDEADKFFQAVVVNQKA